MKTLRWLAIAVPTLFIFIQFLGPEKTNPPINPPRTIAAHVQIPPEINAIFERACQNCHSHKTQWPWYSNLAPISWFVIDHVNFGRSHINLSDWAQYDQEKQISLFEEICEIVEKGEMPLEPYLWMHDKAHLTQQDIRAICEWTMAEQKRLMSEQQK
ncbi:heme-binding domain-containing protein [Acidobacteria bacterium AH-259-O06]|nr:heme-binding domain-containing protein [Acidobacteria bacterium AH-259-L09]MDA2929152.1 heme-binding domain-containing protein [Acidobacteria bacterium AH-259-O06]